jgi:hypothetical protein
MPGDQVSRRRVLAGLGATLLVSGCSAAPRSGDEPVEAPTVDPDEEILRAAADAERALLAAYGATIARHPTLTERLAVFSAHHGEHLAAFTNAPPSPSGPIQSATANPIDPAAATGVSDDPLAAVATLATAERAAAGRSLGDLDGASPTLARLLASVGAAEAAHAALLGT